MRLNWFLLTAAVTLLASCNAASAVDGFDQTKLSKSVSSSTDAVEKGTRFLRGAADTVNDGSDESDEERDIFQKAQLIKWWLDDRTLAQAEFATKNDHIIRNAMKRFQPSYIGSYDHKKYLNYEVLLKKMKLKEQQVGDMEALKLKLTGEKVSKEKMKQEVQKLTQMQQGEAWAYKLKLKKELAETLKKLANKA